MTPIRLLAVYEVENGYIAVVPHNDTTFVGNNIIEVVEPALAYLTDLKVRNIDVAPQWGDDFALPS